MQEEESLVLRAQQGDRAALSEIFETYFDRLYRYVALRIGSREEAEDVAQQVFMKALQALGSYHWNGTPLGAWLFRIARNLVIDYHRKQHRTRELLREVASLDAADDPVYIAEQSLMLAEVRGAFPRLTQSQQEVLRLRFGAELSIVEAARAMGKTEGAVKALQHSALAALRRILTKRGEEKVHEKWLRPGLRGMPGAYVALGRDAGPVPEDAS